MGTAENLFGGPPAALPEPMPRGSALYREGPGPAVVRHLHGYAPFLDFCAGQGAEAEELAADPQRLIAFLRTYGGELANSSTLSAAAAVFAGNTIARLRPDAEWTAYEGALPTVGNRDKEFEVDRLLEALRGADDEAVQGLVSVLSDWAREEPERPPARPPHRERYPVGRERWSEYALAAFDGSGSESGQGEPAPASPGRLHDAELRLREVAGGWSPWPLRRR